MGFWAERLREAKYSISDEQLRPYFALPNVLNGLFQVHNGLPCACTVTIDHLEMVACWRSLVAIACLSAVPSLSSVLRRDLEKGGNISRRLDALLCGLLLGDCTLWVDEVCYGGVLGLSTSAAVNALCVRACAMPCSWWRSCLE